MTPRLHRGIRWNQETQAWELRCDDCVRYGRGATYWPLTQEFWSPRAGVARCRACWAEKKRRDERERKRLKREEILEANRRYYRENHELLRWKDNERKRLRRAA